KLRARLEGDSGDPELHRRLGEALIEDGQRDEGIAELEAAIWELERMGAFGQAYALANEILHVEPDSVRFHQKRVEFAFRTGERSRLVDAYLELGDSLVRSGELPKARVVYQRVIGLAPDDARARVALDTIREPYDRPPTPPEMAAVPPALPPIQTEAPKRPATPRAAEAVRPSSWQTPATSEFVDLAAWMEEDDQPKSTRMVAEGIVEPADGAQADFAEMLEKFKEGVAANVDEGDFQSHYDLGIAYREMGLIDEAIAEFQKALRSTDDRVKTYEALGQCFIEKGHFPVAATLLTRALADGRRGDDTLIGVLYMLGNACEALGRHSEARSYYERVYSVDIRFRDVNDRLAATAQSAR
ncbi:MAG: tetratricopeptide repeat protein, partial [Gemmatimonadaceae bacterium]